MLDFHTVYRVQMRNKGCKGHLEFRIASGNGGTGTCRRGADEHGCEFAPVAGSRYAFIEFPMSLTALPRIKIIRTEAGVIYIYIFIFSCLFVIIIMHMEKCCQIAIEMLQTRTAILQRNRAHSIILSRSKKYKLCC